MFASQTLRKIFSALAEKIELIEINTDTVGRGFTPAETKVKKILTSITEANGLISLLRWEKGDRLRWMRRQSSIKSLQPMRIGINPMTPHPSITMVASNHLSANAA